MPRKRSALTEKQTTYVETVLSGEPASHMRTQAKSETVKAALKAAREEIEEISTIKRIDVLHGIMEAIDLARLAAEPASMISGWKEIAKIMGYYAPETKRIELTSDQEALSKKIEQLSDHELIEMLQKRSLIVDVD